MSYLKTFNNFEEYAKAKEAGELSVPNVSLVLGESKCYYSPNPKNVNFGDILLFDKRSYEYRFISPEGFDGFWQDATIAPIGVVAIPAKYTPDNKIRLVSLKNMSLRNPELGTGEPKAVENDNYMCWGGNGIDLGLPNLDKVTKVNPLTGETTGTDSWVRIPSDQKYNSTGYIDPLSGCYYYYNNYIGDESFTGDKEDKFGPYPILKNGEMNPQYYSEDSCTSDFNGKQNTEIIISAAEGTGWKSGPLSNNANKGNYPAAFCCKRFKTPGTESGSWYLPAIGEAMFLNTHYAAINKGLNAISNKLGTDAIRLGRDGNFGLWYWSSSEYGSGLARDVTTLNGYVNLNGKADTTSNNRVRAFFAL